MKMGRKMLAWLALAGMTSVAAAAPEAVVEVVQAPAWVERGEARLPLRPGMALENRDRVVTGSGARAVVQLADGSAVKLGENALVGVNALGRREGGVFTAALDVAKGAFRLTTDIFRKHLSTRAINVRVGTVTAGIRGTDLWGKSSGERDFICLLEGRIAVSHPQGESAELSEPYQFYGADAGQAPGPVAVADRVQVAKWALETELVDGVGMQRAGGRWAVRLATLDTEAAALELYDRAAAAGYGVRILPRRGERGGYRYEVRLAQIPDEAEARRLAGRLARELGLEAPAVVRR